jgi:hypothetical protein
VEDKASGERLNAANVFDPETFVGTTSNVYGI